MTGTPRNADNVNALVDGNVYVAPKGSTLPTDPTTAPAVAFKNLGWTSDTGFGENVSTNTNTRRGIDGSVIKTFKTDDDSSFTFECLEEDAIVLGLVYPGSTPVTATAVTTTPVKSYLGSDIRAWVIDEDYGTYQVRKVVPLGQAFLTGAVQVKPGDAKTYSFRVDAYADSTRTKFIRISNNPAEVVP